MDQIREKRVELILQQLEELPTLPAVAVRVLEVTGNDDSSAKEVVALISSDQSLTTRILQLLHRADTGVRGDIDTVDRAVVMLGFDGVGEAPALLRGNIADLERSIIGLDHMVVGKRLAERWGLPLSIRECVWLHGQAPEALPQTVKHPRLVNLITLADALVREQHI